MTIETQPGKVVRSRVDNATACYYPGHNRVVMVADRADFAAAETVLRELREAVTGGEYLGCMDCGGATFYPPMEGATDA